METGAHDSSNELLSQLPLVTRTPAAWAKRVLSNPIELLNDHAHLEKKAASNALDLISLWPHGAPPRRWVQVLTSIVRDEAAHLSLVVRLLDERGGSLSKYHANPYAHHLRDFVRRGEGPNEVLDRLFASALIEARSCERFLLLGVEATDPKLATLYKDLFASERTHYQIFFELAHLVAEESTWSARWREFMQYESQILAELPEDCTMHSGFGA